MVSGAQLAWATDAIRSSDAVFKVVVTSVHLTDHGPSFGDTDLDQRWQGFPEQRAALIAAAEAAGPGVVLLTGDMHYGGIQRVAPAGEPGAGLIEIAAGPSGSEPWPISDWFADNGGVPPQYLALVDTWSCARLTADPVARRLDIELVGDDGAVLASAAIDA
jgi:hypothetical protein